VEGLSLSLSLSVLPRAEASRAQPHEDGADELAEGGGVDGLQLLLLAVQQVVAVERGARQTHAFSRLVVVQQPLYLAHRQGAESQAAAVSKGEARAEETRTLQTLTHSLTRVKRSRDPVNNRGGGNRAHCRGHAHTGRQEFEPEPIQT